MRLLLPLIIFIFNYLSTPQASISEEKCKEYEDLSFTPKVCTSLLLFDFGSGHCLRHHACDSSAGLIVGGEKANLHEFPHFALLGYDFGDDFDNDWRFHCGGSLISEKFIITAAHCRASDGIKASLIRLGESDLSPLMPRNHKVADYPFPPENFIPHPFYNASLVTNDIALIKLMTNVAFSNQVRPACLHQNTGEVLKGKKVIAIGFGAIAYGDDSSEKLLKVNLTVIRHSQCNQVIEKIEKSQLCVKGEMTSDGLFADTCQGDSGGPIQVISETNHCMYNLIGITSYGHLCGFNIPAIYTRISSYLPWIEDIVWGDGTLF